MAHVETRARVFQGTMLCPKIRNPPILWFVLKGKPKKVMFASCPPFYGNLCGHSFDALPVWKPRTHHQPDLGSAAVELPAQDGMDVPPCLVALDEVSWMPGDGNRSP